MNIVRLSLLKTTTVAIVVVIVLGVAGISWFLATKNNTGKVGERDKINPSLIRVVGYNHIDEGAVACAAITPGCGVCYGEVVNKECYVTKEEFTEFKKVYPGLEGDPAQ